MESLDGTVIERRIDDVLDMGKTASQAYKPRLAGANKNVKNYTNEMYQKVKKTNSDIHHIFGYVNDEKVPEHTRFMDYGGQADPSCLTKLNYYKELNSMAMNRRMQTKHGDLPGVKVPLKDDNDSKKSKIGSKARQNPW